MCTHVTSGRKVRIIFIKFIIYCRFMCAILNDSETQDKNETIFCC